MCGKKKKIKKKIPKEICTPKIETKKWSSTKRIYNPYAVPGHHYLIISLKTQKQKLQKQPKGKFSVMKPFCKYFRPPPSSIPPSLNTSIDVNGFPFPLFISVFCPSCNFQHFPPKRLSSPILRAKIFQASFCIRAHLSDPSKYCNHKPLPL